MHSSDTNTLLHAKSWKMKVCIFDLIEPGENPVQILKPMIEVRGHAAALVLHGS